MPSEYEGLPISALEAAACGLPLVVYDAPGLREVVELGKCGAMATDVPTLAEQIGRLAADEPGRHDLALAGRASVLSRYDREAWVRRHAALYGAGIQ